MAITSADLVFYAAANKPENDTSTNGGAIDADIQVTFTDIAADDDVEVVSSNAGDTTQTVTVRARQENGVIDQQIVTLNGTTPVVLSTMGVVERIISATLSADAAGVVTVRRQGAGATIGTIPIGERGFRRMFIGAAAASGSGKDYYEKFFIKNNHATLSLLGAIISQNADPTGKITFTLAAAVDDSATSTNRLTAPSAANTDPDTYDDTAKAVPGTNLAAGSAIGVWVKLALTAGDAPIKSSFTLQIDGSST